MPNIMVDEMLDDLRTCSILLRRSGTDAIALSDPLLTISLGKTDALAFPLPSAVAGGSFT